MNLIKCAHHCVHQKDGYCTLQQLNQSNASMNTDCLYFCSASCEQPPQVTNTFDRNQL